MTKQDKHEYNKQYAHDTYVFNKEHGICVRCRKNRAMVGATYCNECAKKVSEYNKARRLKPEIKARNLEYRRNLRDKYRAEGRCPLCGKTPPLGKYDVLNVH